MSLIKKIHYTCEKSEYVINVLQGYSIGRCHLFGNTNTLTCVFSSLVLASNLCHVTCFEYFFFRTKTDVIDSNPSYLYKKDID
jgi:hypothetical protein